MNEINTISERKKNSNKTRDIKAANRSDLLNASLKAIFINQKVHIFSSLISIKGTCVDIIQGDFCVSDASYKIFSATTDFYSEGESSYMMVPRFGKNIAIED